MRTALAVMGFLVVALLGVDALTRSGSGAAAPPPVAPVGVIAKRVEALRGLRYVSVPRAAAVTPAQARRDGLADFDRSYPRARRLADEEMLTLLGLAPAGVSLRDVSASLFTSGVAGYYDPRTKRLRTVTGAATGMRVLAETVLAHELTHALEDQRFRLLGDAADLGAADSDADLARLALIEGTATTLMEQYMRRYFSAEEALAGALASAFGDTGSMPPFLQAQTLFPYAGGAAFVQDLLARAGGRWALVDTAERLRPPASTEHVLHPRRYLRADQPLPVGLRAGAILGPGWTRAGSGTWGELQTRAMLAQSGGQGSAAAAAGWGGDHWELWRTRSLGDGCPTPCRAEDVLAMRWRWDTTRDRAEFAARLRAWVRDGLPGAAAGRGGVWEVGGGAAAVADRGGAVTLVLAPSAALARRVAAAR
jgi:hypothetical protein